MAVKRHWTWIGKEARSEGVGTKSKGRIGGERHRLSIYVHDKRGRIALFMTALGIAGVNLGGGVVGRGGEKLFPSFSPSSISSSYLLFSSPILKSCKRNGTPRYWHQGRRKVTASIRRELRERDVDYVEEIFKEIA